MRKTFVDTLTVLARRNPEIICVIGDTGFSVFEDFEREFKERFVNTGIAEQNFISFGAGLAAMGMKPYLYNVVSFMTLRGMEQILLDICYQENPVVLVGVGGGHAYGSAGPTHHSGQDIAMMRTLPNMTIVCPADPVEMQAVLYESEHYNKPLYIRIGRSIDPVIHEKEIDFKIGKAIQLTEGNQGVLFATGTMVKDAIQVYHKLKKQGINISLYSMHTIKPIDEEVILESLEKYDAIFTLEEHSKIGGLGSAVSEILIKKMNTHHVIFEAFGFPDMFAPVTGSRESLNCLYGIDSDHVAERIKTIIMGKPSVDN